MQNIYLRLVFFILLSISLPKAQTNALNIRWDINPEPDMYQYHLYRSVNNLTNFQFLNFITHPDSNYNDQLNIEPGNLYSYALVAVDSAGNQSDFSDTVAVGLPVINWTVITLSNAETTQVNLSDILMDPDHHFSEITFEILNSTHIGSFQVPQSIYLFSEPAGYFGSANISFKATDPDGFWDYKSVSITIINDLPISIDNGNNPIPLTTTLYQNFPNPFNPSTQLRFGMTHSGHVSIVLTNILGEEVRTIYQGWKEAGYHQVEMDGSNLAGGIYFVNMRMDEYQKTIKIFLMK